MKYNDSVQRWDVFEVRAEGVSEGNPFTEREITGTFTSAHESVTAVGFYDGKGQYAVRFMPSFEEEYHFTISGNYGGGEESGSFTVTAPAKGNHGPVRVAGTFHFAYEDGTPYYPIGTTCYVWELRSDEEVAKTLRSLEESSFNKIRFCIFPKHYDYNLGEPRSYPYEGTPMDSSVLTKENFAYYYDHFEGNHFDLTRFNPEHFRHIEYCIKELGKRGIEADLIVMHPYDRWGFSAMTWEQDELYWNYVLARFSAFHNVWWALANEYDLLKHKTEKDWEHYADLIVKKDPYNHLRSIHNCRAFYDHSRPWITHCSIQRQDLYKSSENVNFWREQFRKPIVLDEIAYEGNIELGWGNLTGEELTRRFWEALCRGGYPGHGETYMHPEDILWWSHGVTLHGESWKRFDTVLKMLKETPGIGLRPYQGADWDDICAVPECEAPGTESYFLYYYSFMRPSFRKFHFDDEHEYAAEVIDTWENTITEVGTFRGAFKVDLPGKPYMAIRIRRV